MPELGLPAAMNAKIIGSGSESIILAHGFGADQSVWDNIVPNLSEHYRVVIFDWSFSSAIKDPDLFDPAKYCSYNDFAEDLIALMNELSLSDSIFVGHSMAGMIGCIASVKMPQLFKRLVLVGASPRYLNSENYEGGFENSEINQILSSIESNFDKWASEFPYVVIDSKDSHSLSIFKHSLTQMKPQIALHVAKQVFLCDERHVLERVSIPCTIIQTSNDAVVPTSVAYFMIQNIKAKSTVQIIQTDGHFPQLTSPLQFLDVLGRALEKNFFPFDAYITPD